MILLFFKGLRICDFVGELVTDFDPGIVLFWGSFGLVLSVLTWRPVGFWVVVKLVIRDSTRASEVSALPRCRVSMGLGGKGYGGGNRACARIPRGIRYRWN